MALYTVLYGGFMSSIGSITSGISINQPKKENLNISAADIIFEAKDGNSKQQVASVEFHQNDSSAAKAYYDTQVYAQEKTENSLSEVDKSSPSAVEEFLEYIKMTPAERIRVQVLREEGLTEEDYAKLSPEEKAKIDEKISQRIEQALKDEVGDISSVKEAISQYNYLSEKVVTGTSSGEDTGFANLFAIA
ncbi:MAG: hypothetical protein K0R98_973 [Rickettsiaceae bacterium]|jgi:hypothetical protein|nr:hypothetical protein [Rickettsiaceae bacterium]